MMTENQERNEEDRRLDRLVDGELSGGEYRDLLAALDRDPDGWRRCAMAFLEDQAWRQDLPALRYEKDKKAALAPAATATKPAPARWMGLLLAMAASFLVAFTLGTWWRSGVGRTGVKSEPAVVQHETLEDSKPELVESAASADSRNDSLPEFPLDHMTFVVDRGDGQRESIEMPVFGNDDASARQAVERAMALPRHIRRAIRQSGFEVRRQREWKPVRLQDGRRVIFPIDQLEITPVSSEAYQ